MKTRAYIFLWAAKLSLIFGLIVGCSYYATDRIGRDGWSRLCCEGMTFEEINSIFEKESICPDYTAFYDIEQLGGWPKEITGKEYIYSLITENEIKRTSYIYFVSVSYGWKLADWVYFLLDDSKRLVAVKVDQCDW